MAAATWLLLVLPTGLAQAQQPSASQSSAIRSNCRSDFMANCSGVTPGGKDALDCLKQNLAKLSAPCQTAIIATMPAPPAAAPAAAAPAATAPPAAASQTPAAAPTVAPLTLRPIVMPERRMVITAICSGDAQRLCPGVPPIGSGLLDCLAEKAAGLSPNCYDALKRISRE